MKNIYLLSAGKKDKPPLALSVFFMVVFLSGPFSGRFLDMNPFSKHASQYSENHAGSNSFFISLNDSAQDNNTNTDDKIIADKPDHTAAKDTCYAFPRQKCNLNLVMW
jgi:hypothetical protein